jgi:ferredoxin
MLYIDPNSCIECQACIPVCPVQAIFEEADLPQESLMWLALNAERSAILPVIEEKQTPLKGVG